MKPASYWVEKYNMQSHPEGGYFAETYRSSETIGKDALPNRFSGDRSYATGIYFLLEGHHFSAFHRIQSDEMWHFYAGNPLSVYYIDFEGNIQIIKLGNNPDNGEVFQAVVPAGVWFGSKPSELNGYSLVGCTVAPAFDFADFELADRATLIEEFPQHR
ncbi:MAG: cupin domain-containing protein, partial [Spirosomaceae bacterium]|nr:cupin domain-containing protein [Spirosomataceae bacterium]